MRLPENSGERSHPGFASLSHAVSRSVRAARKQYTASSPPVLCCNVTPGRSSLGWCARTICRHPGSCVCAPSDLCKHPSFAHLRTYPLQDMSLCNIHHCIVTSPVRLHTHRPCECRRSRILPCIAAMY